MIRDLKYKNIIFDMIPLIILTGLTDIIDQYFNSYDRFSTFGDGLYYAIYGIVVLYSFVYIASRGHAENSHKAAFDGLYPAIVITLFAALMGFTKPMLGVILFIVYYLTMKFGDKMPTYNWVRVMIQITFLLAIGAFLTHEIGFFFLIVMFAIMYLQGNMRFDAKKKAKKIEEKKK